MANTGASGGNQSQDGDRGLQAIWRVIEEPRRSSEQSTQNMTRQLEALQTQLQALMRVVGQRNENNDEEQGGGVGPARPIVNPIPNLQNQRRLAAGFDDTSDEEADFGEIALPHGRQRGGRPWQPITEAMMNTN